MRILFAVKILIAMALLTTVFLLNKESSFVQNLSATLIGAFVGVMGAFVVQRKTSHMAKGESQINLLEMFEGTLKRNEAIIEGFLNTDQKFHRRLFELTFLDAALLDSTASVKYELIDDLSLNESLDAIRCILKFLNWSGCLWMERYLQDPGATDNAMQEFELEETLMSDARYALELVLTAKQQIQKIIGSDQSSS